MAEVITNSTGIEEVTTTEQQTEETPKTYTQDEVLALL